MKNKTLLVVLLVVVALNIFLLFSNNTLNTEQARNAKKIDQLEQKIFTLSQQGIDIENDFELAVYMQRILTHVNKLWFSGQADNKELVQFYIHELEESMGAIIDAHIVYDGVPISPLMTQFGMNSIEAFEDDLAEGKDFSESYQLFIAQCNNCHNSSKHSYIQIKIPETPSFDNQEYRPKH